jgi:uncharacterized SAM-binding protein YcdF (DUF218 family)
VRRASNQPPISGRERLSQAVWGAVLLGLAWLGASVLGLDDVMGIVGLNAIAGVGLLGALLGYLGLTRWLRGLAGTVFATILLVGACPPLGRLEHGLVRRDPLPAQPVNAIVALAGSVSGDGTLGPAATDRLLEAMHLLRDSVSTRLVLSRVRAVVGHDTVYSDADQRFLLLVAGLAPELHILDPVGSTRLEAVRAAALGRELGWTRLVVVTSPSHSSRACAAFEKVGFEVICRPSADRQAALETQPHAHDRIAAFGLWLYERLAWAEYRLRGWV